MRRKEYIAIFPVTGIDGVTHRIFLVGVSSTVSFWEGCSDRGVLSLNEISFVREYGYGPRLDSKVTCLGCLADLEDYVGDFEYRERRDKETEGPAVP